jgi:hypothetical protein
MKFYILAGLLLAVFASVQCTKFAGIHSDGETITILSCDPHKDSWSSPGPCEKVETTSIQHIKGSVSHCYHKKSDFIFVVVNNGKPKKNFTQELLTFDAFTGKLQNTINFGIETTWQFEDILCDEEEPMLYGTTSIRPVYRKSDQGRQLSKYNIITNKLEHMFYFGNDTIDVDHYISDKKIMYTHIELNFASKLQIWDVSGTNAKIIDDQIFKAYLAGPFEPLVGNEDLMMGFVTRDQSKETGVLLVTFDPKNPKKTQTTINDMDPSRYAGGGEGTWIAQGDSKIVTSQFVGTMEPSEDVVSFTSEGHLIELWAWNLVPHRLWYCARCNP